MGFVHDTAFSPALDQCRQSQRIRDAGKAMGKGGVVGTKIVCACARQCVRYQMDASAIDDVGIKKFDDRHLLKLVEGP